MLESMVGDCGGFGECDVFGCCEFFGGCGLVVVDYLGEC